MSPTDNGSGFVGRIEPSHEAVKAVGEYLERYRPEGYTVEVSELKVRPTYADRAAFKDDGDVFLIAPDGTRYAIEVKQKTRYGSIWEPGGPFPFGEIFIGETYRHKKDGYTPAVTVLASGDLRSAVWVWGPYADENFGRLRVWNVNDRQRGRLSPTYVIDRLDPIVSMRGLIPETESRRLGCRMLFRGGFLDGVWDSLRGLDEFAPEGSEVHMQDSLLRGSQIYVSDGKDWIVASDYVRAA